MKKAGLNILIIFSLLFITAELVFTVKYLVDISRKAVEPEQAPNTIVELNVELFNKVFDQKFTKRGQPAQPPPPEEENTDTSNE